MKSTKSRVSAYICIAALLISMCCSWIPSALALSSNPVTDIDRTAPDHDISVMSFNVLEHDTADENTYSYSGTVRANTMLQTVQTYMPDIVGVQEASNSKTSTGYKWRNNLPGAMSNLGYSYSLGGYDDIEAGLIIFYKTDRFSLATDRTSSGNTKMGGSYSVYVGSSKKTGTEKDRYYHWVALRDTTHNNRLFYVFNTHFANTSSIDLNNSAASFAAVAQIRTQEAAELAAAMKSKASSCPCFATGDYNCSWDNSSLDYSRLADYNNANPTHQETLSTVGQLNTITDSAYGNFADSGKVASKIISYNPKSAIDHIFFNDNYAQAVETRAVYDIFNSVQSSDHRAELSYFNYRIGAEINTLNGEYDAANKTLTDTTEDSSYTFDIQPYVSGCCYSVFDEDGNTLIQKATAPDDVALTKRINKFTIKFYNQSSASYAFNTINATIKYTDAPGGPVVSQSGGQSVYFANDSWHVVLNKSNGTVTLSLTNTDGKLYKNSGCTATTSLTLTGVKGGVTTYYVKSKAGEVVPVKICKESVDADPDSTVQYCDDDIDNSFTGTVAFIKDDKTVIIGQCNAGKTAKMYGSLNDAMVYGSWDAVINVAPGVYDCDTNGANIKNSSQQTLLGNNAGISPINATDTTWTKSNKRLPESIIKNGLVFQGSRDSNYTIKGFTFTGKAAGGFYLNTGSAGKVATIDFEQNIFENFHPTNASNGSCINLNSSYTQKTGVIKDNYFESSYSANYSNDPDRAFSIRNANNLTIEHNYFKNYRYPFVAMAEVKDSDTTAGYLNMAIQYNRFDNCGESDFYINNIGSSTSANLVFKYNDFVRCGSFAGGCSAINVNLNEKTNATTFANCSLTLFGNRFTDCQSGITLSRSSANLQSNLSNMTVRMNQNRFIQTNSANISSAKIQAINLFTWLQSSGSSQSIPSNWNFDYNYYLSDYLTTGSSNTDTQSKYYINGKDGGDTYFGDVSKPSYTTTSLSAYKTGTGSTTNASAISGVSATNFSGTYDGNPHSITVNGVPSGATVSYAWSETTVANPELLAYQSENPGFIDVGMYYVYYQVEQTGKLVFSGSATVTINGPAFPTADANAITVTSVEKLGVFTPVVSGQLTTDEVSYYVDGSSTPFNGVPSFSEGRHTVRVVIERKNYAPLEKSINMICSQDSLHLFDISVTEGELFEIDDETYDIHWKISIDANENPAPEFDDSKDLVVKEYGITYASSEEILVHYIRTGEITNSNKLKTQKFTGKTVASVTKIYKFTNFELNSVSENKYRHAVAYVKYEVDGDTYIDFSPIDTTSTIYGGAMGGNGGVDQVDDGLDD